jgi:4-amino-4-deoxy-L-arabinose transferase-like glycosyltransferase
MTKRKYTIILILLVISHLFFRFFRLEQWANFGWDQVDNAWAAANILIEHKMPLLGMVAKQNSGMYIGPLYYYFVSLFYFFTNLHPIASPIIAGVSAIFSFWTIYYVSKRLFSTNVALWSCFIYNFSQFIIRSERNQWPVNFVAPLSILILYSLYKVVLGNSRHLLYLALFVGLSFHLHFTAIFYPLIILLSLPIIPWRQISWRHVLGAFGIFTLLSLPQIIYYTTKNTASAGNYGTYFRDYYHGLHLRRVLQIAHDAFIEFESILSLPYKILRNAVFFWVPIFSFLFLWKNKKPDAWKLIYLISLWIVVPWIVFATYKGEISDYYFSLHIYLVVIILGFITNWLWERKNIFLRIGIAAFWLYFAFANAQEFMKTSKGNIQKNIELMGAPVREDKYVNFVHGDPQSYIYFYLMYAEKKPLPYKL